MEPYRGHLTREDDEECARCGGTGKQEINLGCMSPGYWGIGDGKPDTIDCPECEGAGTVRPGHVYDHPDPDREYDDRKDLEGL